MRSTASGSAGRRRPPTPGGSGCRSSAGPRARRLPRRPAWPVCYTRAHGGRRAVRLLGPVRLVTSSGAEVAFRGHVARLLAWLALRPDRAWPADDLAARLWPEGPPPTARTAIQGHVSRLRRTLAAVDGDRHRSPPAGGYALAGPAEAAVDVHRFAAAVRRGRRPPSGRLGAPRRPTGSPPRSTCGRGRARRRCGADPLLGPEAEALDDQRRDAEERLRRGAGRRRPPRPGPGAAGAPGQRRAAARAALGPAHDRAGPGRPPGRRAARPTARPRPRWSSAPGSTPVPSCSAWRRPSCSRTRPSTPPAGSPRPARRPAPLTGLVGRDDERGGVARRLRAARLVTVVGPGGVGKTTLAVDVGAGEIGAYTDGVVVVDLAPAGADDRGRRGHRRPRWAPPAGATPPLAAPDGEEPLARAAAALARRHVLVVLDNCEHVAADGRPGRAGAAAGRSRPAGAGHQPGAAGRGGRGGGGARPAGGAARGRRRRRRCGARPRSSCWPAASTTWAARWPARRTGATRPTIVRALDGLPLALEIVAASARVEPLGALARRLAADSSARAGRRPAGGRRPPPAGRGPRRRASAGSTPTPPRLYALAQHLPRRLRHLGGGRRRRARRGRGPRRGGPAGRRLAGRAGRPQRSRARLLQPVRAHAAARLAPGAARRRPRTGSRTGA